MGDAEVTAFAARLGVDRTTLSRLLNGRAGISAPMALKLEAALNTSAEMWMTMQAHHDLWQARQHPRAVYGMGHHAVSPPKSSAKGATT